MTDRILALWATPRTLSTAFERMVIERGDHLVLDEPFARAYYFGPDRRSDRYPLSMPESTYANVRDGVLRTAEDHPRVFVKCMAYQAGPGLTDEDLERFTHTFLVRDPDAALASLARAWPDFTDDEAGYRAQHELFRRVLAQGGAPVVVDSDELRADPEGITAAWCAAVGLEPRPDALQWEPGLRPEWPLWHDWFADVAESSGFRPASGEPVPAPDPARADLHREARAQYEDLAVHRLRPG
ncbi:MAG TPA: hypothetical protein VD926_09660 [Acidimicrobiales bacterium]|nr:hypothetical protein [Acidimicrobiales bacterium]